MRIPHNIRRPRTDSQRAYLELLTRIGSPSPLHRAAPLPPLSYAESLRQQKGIHYFQNCYIQRHLHTDPDED
jgi:hypothetical protein